LSSARVRLASLGLSQSARSLADWCLRMFVVLEVAGLGDRPRNFAPHLVTALYIAPFILLAPTNGALSNAFRKRGVLVASAAFCLVALAACAALGGHWLVSVALVAVGMAVYSPTRYALLPAAAEDTRLPLPRVMGWIEMGAAAGIVGGALLGIWLQREGWSVGPLPAAVAVALAASAVALLAALPARFAADVWRPEPPARAVAGFFRDARRVAANPAARGSLLGLAAFMALVAAGAGALISYTCDPHFADQDMLWWAMVLVAVGAAAGSLLACLQGSLHRGLGLVPLSATVLLAALAWALLGGGLTWPCLLIGLTTGLANVPLRSSYQAAVPADARGNGMAVMNGAIFVATTALSVGMFLLTWSGLLGGPLAQLAFLAVLAAAFAAAAWRLLLRESVEQVAELLLWPMYRVRVHGPGVDLFPKSEPVLVIANHTAWLDPCWLMKVLPRPLTPMMLSSFYDLPGWRWLLSRVFGVIRVAWSNYRQEAPELDEAVAALERGECVLIFPEAWLARRPNHLHRFGQGAWRILRARPKTSVVFCWIEGGWGSFTSHAGGPPLHNKWPDLGRRIDVAVSAPQVLDPALLEDGHATRDDLRRRCLAARRHLGLGPLPS
jgi:1-acyl-sn-glycerol-3-phosphate acyltransferase